MASSLCAFCIKGSAIILRLTDRRIHQIRLTSLVQYDKIKTGIKPWRLPALCRQMENYKSKGGYLC